MSDLIFISTLYKNPDTPFSQGKYHLPSADTLSISNLPNISNLIARAANSPYATRAARAPRLTANFAV
ncbi:MAG: hypothetical protein ACPG8W_12880 [Candidatus Promineifilaceae bacterium]